MYTSFMNRKKLENKLSLYYKKDSIKSILTGRRKPSYEVILKLHEKENIPFTAWKDIKSFITESLSEDENKVNNTNQEKSHETISK